MWLNCAEAVQAAGIYRRTLVVFTARVRPCESQKAAASN